MNIDFRKQRRLLDKAEVLLKEGKTNEINDIFKNIFGNDTNYIHAVILTESNPEYSLYSKELNDLLHKYYIEILMSNIKNNIKKLW